MYSLENNLPDARDAFESAISRDPNYAPAYLERGLLFVKSDVIDEGLRSLERYLELIGDDTAGTMAFEIKTLTEQLRQTSGAQLQAAAQ